MTQGNPTTSVVSANSARGWPRRTSMPSAFTAFVRSLQGEETPDADLFHDAWHSLQKTLESEMKKRGLWQRPPYYLGVYGWDRWAKEESTGDPMAPGEAPGTQVGALGELVVDCYAFIFVDRLRSLKRQLEDKPDIDGLVVLNIRHFLYERQREHDPVGSRIFEMLQAAVQDAISCRFLRVLAGDERVRNDTLLGFERGVEPRPVNLAQVAARWNDELLPELLGARGRRQAKTVVRLRQRVLELSEQGVRAFLFKDLLDPLKNDARLRWAALLAGGAAPSPAACSRHREQAAQGPALPDCPVESRQSLERLASCVSASIRQVEADPHTRTHLSALWQFLRLRHGGCEAEGPGSAEGQLSHRTLGRLLHIPRERLPALFAILRQLVARCLAARTARPRARPSEAQTPPPSSAQIT